MARPTSYLTLIDLALIIFALSFFRLIITNNVILMLLHVEVRFAACLLVALADLIVLDSAETAVLIRASINFAALDAALGLVLLISFKKVGKSIRIRCV